MAKLILPSPKLFAIELIDGASKFFSKKFDAITYRSIKEFINNTNEKAKILLMSHSLEHYQYTDLEETLLDIQNSLDEKGVVIIEVPHCDLRIHKHIRGNDTPHTIFLAKKV